MKKLFLLLLSCNVFAVTTPNMLLSSPVVGDTNYPTQITTSLSLIDAHDHTVGKGVQVGSGGLAAGSVVASTIGTSAVTTVKIQDTAVTTAKITDLNVTTAKINALAVTTAKINDLAVTTGKINDLAVTRIKLEAVGLQASSSSGAFSMTGVTLTDVTNLSVTITTSLAGRPVVLQVISASTSASNPCSVSTDSSTSATSVANSILMFLRASSIIGGYVFSGAGGGPYNGNYSFIDTTVAASTAYTYKVQMAGNSGSGTLTTTMKNCKLIAYEL